MHARTSTQAYQPMDQPTFALKQSSTSSEFEGQATINGQTITGIQVRKQVESQGETTRTKYNIVYAGPYYISIDVLESDLPHMTDLLLWIRDNLPGYVPPAPLAPIQ